MQHLRHAQPCRLPIRAANSRSNRPVDQLAQPNELVAQVDDIDPFQAEQIIDVGSGRRLRPHRFGSLIGSLVLRGNKPITAKRRRERCPGSPRKLRLVYLRELFWADYLGSSVAWWYRCS